MLGDCHIHAVLDGQLSWKEAMARHSAAPNEAAIRGYLQRYQKAGVTFLRDGGDKYGVSLLARKLAAEYQIQYLTPGFPIYQNGKYGSFIGKGFSGYEDFMTLLKELKTLKVDFIKLMISGIVDFNQYGVLSCEPMSPEDIREYVHIAHSEGYSVMAHCNGAETIKAALSAGVESIEHGYFMDNEALHQLAESDTVWVPTAVTVGNLVQDSRYPQEITKRIFEEHIWHISTAANWGAMIALGSDAGAYLVPHVQGALDEYDYLKEELGEAADGLLETAEAMIRWKFSGSAEAAV